MRVHSLFFLALSLLFWMSCSKDNPITTVSTLAENPVSSEKFSLPDLDEAALQKEAAKTPEQFLEEEILFRSPVVEVPANSQDALQDAIDRISPHGLIRVKAGQHFESAPIEITKPVKIIGEPGAELIIASDVATLQPAIYVHDTRRVQIWGLDIHPEGEVGGMGILLHNAPFSFVRHNEIHQYAVGVAIEQSNGARVFNNTIVTALLWQTDLNIPGFGVVNINGDNSVIAFNEISHSSFGVWACDKSGSLYRNTAHHNLIGFILCKVPENGLPLPTGLTGSENPATNWLAWKNNAYNNFDVGYLVIDGANHNILKGNRASNNVRVDYDLTMDTFRFGFLTPKSHNNTVYAADGQRVQDCGDDNEVIGGLLVDDPCF